MSRLASRISVLTLSCLVATSAAAQSYAVQPTSAATSNVASDPDVLGAERLFSAWLEGQIAYRGLPGVVVGVVADQQLVWAKGFGFADVNAKKPMTPATKFRMASHSKLFTATSIMQLREQGKLRLDDPVSKYLTWFQLKPAGDDDGPITIEQLLTHASGLPREAGAHWTTLEFPTEDEVRKIMTDRQAAFAPQTRWKYSNLAYTIAGMVVEAVSGEQYADYVQRHIFQPLEMTSSSVDKKVDGMAIGYGRRMPEDRASRSHSSTHAAWGQPPASHQRWKTWRSSCQRSSAPGKPVDARSSTRARCARCIECARSRTTGRPARGSGSG